MLPKYIVVRIQKIGLKILRNPHEFMFCCSNTFEPYGFSANWGHGVMTIALNIYRLLQLSKYSIRGILKQFTEELTII